MPLHLVRRPHSTVSLRYSATTVPYFYMLQSLLHTGSTYLRTDLTYLLQGGFWLSSTKLIGAGTALITSVVLANMLPEHVYGVYRYVLSLLVLLTIPTLIGIDTALTRAIAKDQSYAFMPAFWTKVRWGLIGSVASTVIASYYFWQGDATLGSAFLIAALFIPILDPANLFLAYLAGTKNFKLQTVYQLVIRVASTVAMISTVYVTTNIIVLLLVYFVSYTVLRLGFLVLVLRRIPPASGQTDTTTISFGKHLTIQNIPTAFTKTIDALLVFQFSGAAALAGYSLARIPLKQGQNILGSINLLAFPNLAKREPIVVRRTLPRKILTAYVVIIPAVLCYWLLAAPFFNLLYPQYTAFIFLSQIFMLQLLTLPISLIETTLTAFGEQRRLYFYTVTTSIIRLVLLVSLIPLYGPMGAAAALLITAAIGSGVLGYLFYRHIGVTQATS